MVTGLPLRSFMALSFLCLVRQENHKRAALAGPAMGSDGAAMAGHDLATDGQAHAAAGIFAARMQALERPEDAVQVLLIEADALICDRNLPTAVHRRTAHRHSRRLVRGVELERVAEQVLQQLAELRRIAPYLRQGTDVEVGAALVDARLQVAQYVAQ